MRRGSAEEAVIRQLVTDMHEDGVPLPDAAVLQAIDDPQWQGATGPRDWRVYVPPSVRRGWTTLPRTARLCVFETAELVALSQEVGVTMVTGSVHRGPGSG